jgi:hypothetical protein
MTDPDRALEQARAAAASMRASGAYGDELHRGELQSGPVTLAKLSEWALIEPDLRDVRSTRRLGAPVTALKRGLLRLLGQYHAELLAQQTRFNVNILSRVHGLEQRIEELERKLDERR